MRRQYLYVNSYLMPFNGDIILLGIGEEWTYIKDNKGHSLFRDGKHHPTIFNIKSTNLFCNKLKEYGDECLAKNYYSRGTL